MSYISPYETERQKFIRERSYRIAKAYIQRAGDILMEGVKPTRVMVMLAKKYEMTSYGIACILKRKGIYVNRKHPIVLSTECRQILNTCNLKPKIIKLIREANQTNYEQSEQLH